MKSARNNVEKFNHILRELNNLFLITVKEKQFIGLRLQNPCLNEYCLLFLERSGPKLINLQIMGCKAG